jgi:hypothetical protein
MQALRAKGVAMFAADANASATPIAEIDFGAHPQVRQFGCRHCSAARRGVYTAGRGGLYYVRK